jgi:hypothetical protein
MRGKILNNNHHDTPKKIDEVEGLLEWFQEVD